MAQLVVEPLELHRGLGGSYDRPAMEGEGRTPEEIEAAAQKAGDPDRLMKGEDPETSFLEDARHWRDVYQELLNFKHDLIELTENRVEDLSETAADEIVETDASILDAERHRLEHRYEFWQARCRALEASQEAS